MLSAATSTAKPGFTWIEASVAGTGRRSNVTVTTRGELLAMPEVIGTVAVYSPATSDPFATPSVSVAGAVAWFSVAVSQPVGPVP